MNRWMGDLMGFFFQVVLEVFVSASFRVEACSAVVVAFL